MDRKPALMLHLQINVAPADQNEPECKNRHRITTHFPECFVNHHGITTFQRGSLAHVEQAALFRPRDFISEIESSHSPERRVTPNGHHRLPQAQLLPSQHFYPFLLTFPHEHVVINKV